MRLLKNAFPFFGEMASARLLRWVLPWLLLSQGLAAQSQRVNMEARAPVSIKVQTPFSTGPAKGHAQLIVTIDNRMETGMGTWRLRTEAPERRNRRNQTVFLSNAEFSVPAGQQQTFKLSVPLPNYLRSGYISAYLSGSFEGDYTDRSNFNISLINHSSGSKGVILLSPELYRSHGSAIESIYKDQKTGQLVSRYYQNLLPDDWRCYVGFERMIVSRADWLSIHASAKKAILDAVAAGELELRFQWPEFSVQMASELDFPADRSVWRHGLGVMARYDERMHYAVELLENARTNSDNLLHGQALRIPSDDRLESSRNAGANDELENKRFEHLLKDKVPPAGLLSLLMVIFGVVIGPVNFFVFAKGRRSLRLFITTPIIAGLASIFLLLGILLFDGVGGTGYISRLIYIGEDDQQIYVEQELVADTGLYFAKPFEVAGTDLLTLRGSSITERDQMVTRGTYSKQGEEHSGDWFASKRLQALNLKTYLPLREGFDFLPPADGSGRPEVFSNFRGVCEVFYYVDAGSQVWKVENLKLGARQTLRPVEEKELAAWLAGQQLSAGFQMGRLVDSIGLRPEHYYAKVSDWQQEDLETVSNMRWNLHTQILIGRLGEADTRGGAQ